MHKKLKITHTNTTASKQQNHPSSHYSLHHNLSHNQNKRNPKQTNPSNAQSLQIFQPYNKSIAFQRNQNSHISPKLSKRYIEGVQKSKRSKQQIMGFIKWSREKKSEMGIDAEPQTKKIHQKQFSLVEKNSLNADRLGQRNQIQISIADIVEDNSNIGKAIDSLNIFKSKIDLSNKYTYKHKYLKKVRGEQFEKQEKATANQCESNCKCRKQPKAKIKAMLNNVINQLIEQREQKPSTRQKTRIKSEKILNNKIVHQCRNSQKSSSSFGKPINSDEQLPIHRSLQNIRIDLESIPRQSGSCDQQLKDACKKVSKCLMNKSLLAEEQFKSYNNEIVQKIKQKYNKNKLKYETEFGNILDVIKRKNEPRSTKENLLLKNSNFACQISQNERQLPQLNTINYSETSHREIQGRKNTNLRQTQRQNKSSIDQQMSIRNEQQKHKKGKIKCELTPRQFRYIKSNNECLSGIEYCLVSTKRRFLQKTLSSDLKVKNNLRMRLDCELKKDRKNYRSLEFEQYIRILERSKQKQKKPKIKQNRMSKGNKSPNKKQNPLETKYLCSPWENGGIEQTDFENEESI